MWRKESVLHGHGLVNKLFVAQLCENIPVHAVGSDPILLHQLVHAAVHILGALAVGHKAGVREHVERRSVHRRPREHRARTAENREQAYYDMAYLTENMIMRNRTHGGYKVLVDELWEFCEKMNADMVMMWEHMSCKALVGMHGQFEEQARERGIHLVWVCHDLCDPRVYSRQAIRDQFNEYMRTVMREEPLDPSIEVLPR